MTETLPIVVKFDHETTQNLHMLGRIMGTTEAELFKKALGNFLKKQDIDHDDFPCTHNTLDNDRLEISLWVSGKIHDFVMDDSKANNFPITKWFWSLVAGYVKEVLAPSRPPMIPPPLPPHRMKIPSPQPPSLN